VGPHCVGWACGVTLPIMQVHQTPTLLLTRPRAASEQFAQGLSGAKVVIAPLMEIVSTGADVAINGAEGVIFTSQNAVGFAPDTPLPAYCVGPRTAQVATDAGFDVRVTCSDAEALVQTLQENPPNAPLVHIHGKHTRGDIAARLTANGLPTFGIAAYDQTALPADASFSAALTQTPLIVPLFSPRSARLFAQAALDLSNPPQIIALSQAVAEALPPEWRLATTIVSAPNAKEIDIALEPFGVKRDWP
jgi:uroporphyrinogen-III synthase